MERATRASIRAEFDTTLGLLRAATASGDDRGVQACLAALAELHLREVRLIDAEDMVGTLR